MTFIRLYQRDEGCEIPEGYQYLMVVSEAVDSNGNWIPARVQHFRVIPQVWMALNRIQQNDDEIVVQASANFSGLAMKMGLRMVFAEWRLA